MSYNNPPPYSAQPEKGFVPASTYQPPPQHPQPATVQPTVIIQTVPSVPLSSGPTRVTCPSCHADVVTTVEYESNSTTHCWAIVLCCLFWPCVCVPYCMDSCKDANHYCPNCRAYLGRYTK